MRFDTLYYKQRQKQRYGIDRFRDRKGRDMRKQNKAKSRHSADKRILPVLILICMLTLAAAASMSGCSDTNVPGSGTEKGNTEMEKGRI